MYYKYGDLIEVLKKYQDKFEFCPSTKQKLNDLLADILESEQIYYEKLRFDAEHENYEDGGDDDDEHDSSEDGEW